MQFPGAVSASPSQSDWWYTNRRRVFWWCAAMARHISAVFSLLAGMAREKSLSPSKLSRKGMTCVEETTPMTSCTCSAKDRRLLARTPGEAAARRSRMCSLPGHNRSWRRSRRAKSTEPRSPSASGGRTSTSQSWRSRTAGSDNGAGRCSLNANDRGEWYSSSSEDSSSLMSRFHHPGGRL